MRNSLVPQLIHLSETDSTNQFLRKLSDREKLASGSIVVADFQTTGRGIAGSSWESEAGKNLTFSILYYPLLGVASSSLGVASSLRPFVIAEMASLSVKDTLEKYISGVTVKWPNDIYCGDKKIAGILIENILFQGEITQSIIGIGININQTAFLSDAHNPVSMAQVANKMFDRMDILNEFRQTFAAQSERLNNRQFAAIHADYLQTMYRRTGIYPYRDEQGIFKAVLYDIEPTGHLLLKRANGRISRYAFKEVSYL